MNDVFSLFNLIIFDIMKKEFYLLTLLFLLLSLVEGKAEGASTVVNIKVQGLDEADWMSESFENEIFKPIRYVQLESGDDMLIGKIDKIILNKDRIYILDAWSAESVFVFDRDGNFINKISRKGEGPEEYIDMRDMFYDEFDKTINILSYAGGKAPFKIMSFDRDGAKLVKQIWVDRKIHQVERTKDGRYVFHSKNRSNEPNGTTNVAIYSKSMKYMCDGVPMLPISKDRSIYSTQCLQKDRNGNIYCSSDFITDIYQVTTDSLRHCYHFDFGKYNLPNVDNMEELEKIKWHYIHSLEIFYENESYVITGIIHKGQSQLVIFNKSTQKVIPYRFVGLGDFTDGCLVSAWAANNYAPLFDGSLKKEKEDERTKNLKKQFKHPVQEEDNPILKILEFAF